MNPYLFASDFDQTLSFNDSGLVLSQLIGANNFEQKIHGMSQNNLVQQGGELTYLLLHDPEFRRVRKEHLYETGKRIRLKQNIELLPSILANGIDGYQFIFYVIFLTCCHNSIISRLCHITVVIYIYSNP